MCMGASRQVSFGYAALFAVAAIVYTMWSCASALAAGDANHESCTPGAEASPGFRGFLPDCRAYELVTPPYKSGQPALWSDDEPPPMSADGEHLLGIDFAGLAGTGNEENNGFEVGAIYKFSRTPSGWSTEALEPPASLAARSRMPAASSDLSHSLWELLNQPKEGEEVKEPSASGYSFALREITSDGPRFVKVGPEVPLGAPSQEDFSFNGASHDLSHILFTVGAAEGELWPGDETRAGSPSLYEYTGLGKKEPTLVGVKNHGSLGGSAHVNEDAELASKCGTRLGSLGEGSAYNAVSADGVFVYFTALACEGEPPLVNELYARVDGTKTVDISEPSTGDCKSCNESTPKTALFQGASEDGSKVFFLSEQELLPGAKGENLYEYNFNAAGGNRVTLISSEVSGVARVSEGGSLIYFVATEALTSTPDLSLQAGQQTPIADRPNFYVFDTETGLTAFIGTFSPADGAIWKHEDLGRPVDVTPDGQFVVFPSAAALTVDDKSTVSQLFEYNAYTERLVRVSIGQKSQTYPSGYGDDGDAMNLEDTPTLLQTPQYSGGMIPTYPATGLSLSANGAVVFMSDDTLTPDAVDGRGNIYEYRGGNVYLLSPGDEAAPLSSTSMSRLLGANETGSDVFFFTTDSLLGQDTDTQADWYDAREGGGFPAPVSPAGCTGDTCQGALSAAPIFDSPSTTAPSAADYVTPISVHRVSPAKSRSLTRAQKLARALRACARKRRRQRAPCGRDARRKYGTTTKTASNRRVK